MQDGKYGFIVSIDSFVCNISIVCNVISVISVSSDSNAVIVSNVSIVL